jgi:hypothetical protein
LIDSGSIVAAGSYEELSDFSEEFRNISNVSGLN